MRVHVLRHVSYEGPGLIAEWAAECGHEIAESDAPRGRFPALDEFEMLVVLGGPMDADDHEASPWLVAEKAFITKAIDAGKLVLGICLGAQIIAEVMGGRVRRCDYPEIGWYPVRHTAAAAADPVFATFPDVLVVGHWHSDTFDLPDDMAPVLTSEGCANQAFTMNRGKVVGLQFHLEWTRESLEALVDECIDDLVPSGSYVTLAPDMLAKADRYITGCRSALWMLLDLMVFTAEEGR